MLVRIVLSFFILSLLTVCTGTPEKNESVSEAVSKEAVELETGFSQVKDKTWILAEIHTSEGVKNLDRKVLEADNMGDFFTLSFENNRLSGKGAPNGYYGPYTLGEGNAFSIGNIASTMMAALKEPEFLKERDYFILLARVSRWDFDKGNLLLYSQNETNREVILVFKS
jgi:heat shock protein HslJ